MRKEPLFLIKAITLAFAAVIVVLAISGCGKGEKVSVSEKNVLTLTKENFQVEVLASSQPVLVDFWASWCGPCKLVAPTVAELATELEGKVKVGKVDVDAQKELAEQYNISGIPTLLIFNNGKVVEQKLGVVEKAELKAALEKFITRDSAPKPTNNF